MVGSLGSRRQGRGSARTGQASVAASSWTASGPSMGAPATMMPRRPATASARAATSRSTGPDTAPARPCHGPPSTRGGGNGSGVASSGSRKGRLRWTGPGGDSIVASTARAAHDRHCSAAALRDTGIAEPPDGAAEQVTLVDGLGGADVAELGWPIGGQTTSGTLAWWASTMAGWARLAAVPLVVSTTAGRPAASPSPRAT